jgi:hypothetical protein
MNISSGPNGINMQWLQDGTQCEMTSGEAILVDNLESTYVIAWSKGSIDIQGRTINKSLRIVLMISKYARQGYIQWVKTFDDVESPKPIIACLDNDDHICIAYVDNNNVQVTRITPYGHRLWSKKIEGRDLASPMYNLSMTADTSIYIAGAMNGSVFTDEVIKGTSFLTKITGSGQWDWSKSLPGIIGPSCLATFDKMLVMCTIDDTETSICTVDQDNFTTNIYVVTNLEFDQLHNIVIDNCMNVILIGSRLIGDESGTTTRFIEAISVSPGPECQTINCACALEVPEFLSAQGILVNGDFFFLVRLKDRSFLYQNQFLWLSFEDQPTIGYPAMTRNGSSLCLVGTYMMNMQIKSYNNFYTILDLQGHEKPSFYATKLRLTQNGY